MSFDDKSNAILIFALLASTVISDKLFNVILIAVVLKYLYYGGQYARTKLRKPQ